MLTEFEQETLGLLLSGSIALMVGLIDDFGVLDPSQKMLGQTLAALVLIKSGTFIKLVFLPIYVAIPLTVLWILAVTNAFNIIDIMDGLASGVAAIAALSSPRPISWHGGTRRLFWQSCLPERSVGFSAPQLPSRKNISGRCRKPVHRIHAGGAFDECRLYARRICWP